MSVEPQRALSDDGEVTNTNQPSSEPAGTTMASSAALASSMSFYCESRIRSEDEMTVHKLAKLLFAGVRLLIDMHVWELNTPSHQFH